MRGRPDKISYPTELLKNEVPLIRESVSKALKNLIANDCCKSLGLDQNDPPPLFQWRLKQASWCQPGMEEFFEGISFRGVVSDLAREAADDGQLKEWLERLLAHPGPRIDRLANAEEADQRTHFLLKHWIAPDEHPLFFQKSLCFYSNRALAQAIHFESQRKFPEHQWKPLDHDKRDVADKTAAKLAERLGLRFATKRVIRELRFRQGVIVPVPFRNVED